MMAVTDLAKALMMELALGFVLHLEVKKIQEMRILETSGVIPIPEFAVA